MWTYLAILFSLVLLFAVFSRRAFLYTKAKKAKAFAAENPAEYEPAEENVPKKLRVSKDDKEKISEMYEEAQSFLKKGRDEDAIKNFVQILALDTHHLETLNTLAMLYLQKQMYSASAALLRQLGEQTGEAVHYSHLGLALFQQAEYEESKEAYQRAVTLDPGRPQRFASLAQVYKALGQLNHAVMALNKAIELDEANLDLMFLLVDLKLEMEHLEDAKAVIGKILELDPKNAEAKSYLKKITQVPPQD